MWILWAVLLYFVFAIAAGVVLGKCFRFGLNGAPRDQNGQRGRDLVHRLPVRRNRWRFRPPAALIKAEK